MYNKFMKWYQKISPLQYVLLAVALVAIQIIVLKIQGHIFICDCGFVKFWHGALNSPEDSQHISDWYTFSHMIHGFVFYWLIRKFTKGKLSIPLSLIIAMGIEVGWEILENSPLIINRYRETASLMYYGDSILNSVSDVMWETLGFILAYKLSTKASIAIVIGLELFTLYMIKDNLVLNIIMLAYPFEFIKNWQLGI